MTTYSTAKFAIYRDKRRCLSRFIENTLLFRFFVMLVVVFAPFSMAAGQTLSTTTIQDTVYRADGTPASGTLIVSWPAFTTAANAAVAAGSTTVPIGANGSVELSLAPNAGALPGGTYYTAVYHLSDGTVNKEYWIVPVAVSTTIGEIRSQLVPATVAIQAVNKQYVDAAVSSITGSYLPTTGGTMTGSLLLNGDPTSAQQAADKHYVDDSVGSLLPLSGGSLTGPLTLAADPTAALQAATKEYVDANGGSSAAALAAANAAQATANAALPANEVGVAGGVAPLDATARVPAGMMPTAFSANINTEIDAGSAPFGALCNWTGTTGADDTAALEAAIAAAETAATSAAYPQGTQVVRIPTGICKISGELRVPQNITLRGMSRESSIIQQTSPTANAITVIGCSKALLGGCEGGIYDLTIDGSGHTTAGTLVELDAVTGFSLQNVRLFNTGGRGIQINGGSERLDFRNLTIFMVRWPLILAGAINESYFYDTRVIYPGMTADNYCYNVNCVNGVYPTSGPIAPDPHGAIYSTGGSNEGFYGGSIKPLQMMSGFKMLVSDTTTLDHFYFEDGYVNAGVIAGGVMEWTATTAAMTTSNLSTSVQSTAWMPYYYTSPGDVPTTSQAAYNSFVLIPPDFLWGSTAASSLGSGITRGTYERVALAGFAGDGNMHLGVGGRGQSGTTAIAWPAGALIEIVGSGISSFKVTNSHVNAQDAFSAMGAAGANLTRNCDNSGVNTCAEIIAGYVPDGRWVQQRGNPGDISTGPPVTMNLSNLSMFTGSVSGQGLLAVHSDVALTLDGRASGPSSGEGYSVPYGASLSTVAGGAAVALPTYPNGHQPYFALTDNANQRTSSSTGNLYKQTIAVYESAAHSSVGDQIARRVRPDGSALCGCTRDTHDRDGRNASCRHLQRPGRVYLCGRRGYCFAQRDGHGNERAGVFCAIPAGGCCRHGDRMECLHRPVR